MKKGTLSSQAGFSLVELMVVVAIIGVLAAMSAGQVQKQIAKARQSEAKTNMGALYSAMKVYQAEFGAYTTHFNLIKAGFEGQLRYATGFANAVAKPAADTSATAGNGTINTAVQCAGAGATCLLVATNGQLPTFTNPAASSATAFTIGASSWIFNTTLNDTWTMDQNKNLSNTVSGIP
jgi:type IV pilus assembly protein PilA